MEKVATRQRVKDVISIEIRKFTSELIKIEDQLRQQVETPSNSSSTPASNSRYEVTLKNYGIEFLNTFISFL